jgi:hypothetical protein
MKEWKAALLNDNSTNLVVATTGSKRKAVCFVALQEIVSTTDRCLGCQR